jgi:hypothetical protein
MAIEAALVFAFLALPLHWLVLRELDGLRPPTCASTAW